MLTPVLLVVVAASGLPERQTFGGAMAPAVLPDGAASAYGYVGAPEVAGGYRQGFGKTEFEGKAGFDYFRLALDVELVGRVDAWHNIDFAVAPLLGVAFEWDSGSTYFDAANYSALSLRPRLGVIGTGRLSETVQGIVEVDAPWTIPLNTRGLGGRFEPLGSAGAEFYLGESMTGLVLGQVGLDVTKQPLGVTQLRAGWGIRLGLGFRLF